MVVWDGSLQFWQVNQRTRYPFSSSNAVFYGTMPVYVRLLPWLLHIMPISPT